MPHKAIAVACRACQETRRLLLGDGLAITVSIGVLAAEVFTAMAAAVFTDSAAVVFTDSVEVLGEAAWVVAACTEEGGDSPCAFTLVDRIPFPDTERSMEQLFGYRSRTCDFER